MVTQKKSSKKPVKNKKVLKKSKTLKPLKKVKASAKKKSGPQVKPAKATISHQQLKREEPFGIGIRRILASEIKQVACYTDQPVSDLHSTVHEMRRILKRLRALIWLMEPDIGVYNCHRESAVYRDIGRKISRLRSLGPDLETVKKLRLEFTGKLSEGPLKRTEMLLTKHYEAELIKTVEKEDLFNSLKKDIAKAEAGFGEIQPIHDDALIPQQALRLAFKAGRKCWRKVARKANSINIHEMRKEVKNLQFQLQFLEAYDPKGIHKRIEPLHRLAQLSGTEHDYYELLFFIRKYLPQEEFKKELMFRMSRKMLALRKQILPLARKVYGMKSKKFIAGINLMGINKPELIQEAG